MRGTLSHYLRLGLLAGGLLAGLAGGCSEKTETGYEPRKLSMSDGDRRALYASPFSPESKASEAEKEQKLQSEVPGHMGM
jgi:hypothetical protein